MVGASPVSWPWPLSLHSRVTLVQLAHSFPSEVGSTWSCDCVCAHHLGPLRLQDTRRVFRDEINLIEVELLGREHAERVAAERAAAEASGAARLQRLQEQLLQTRIKYNRAKYAYYHPFVKGYK